MSCLNHREVDGLGLGLSKWYLGQGESDGRACTPGATPRSTLDAFFRPTALSKRPPTRPRPHSPCVQACKGE